MADAKIIIETVTNNEDIKELNSEISKSNQQIASMTRELKELQKATEGGSKATNEQKARIEELTASIRTQKTVTKQLNKEVNNTANAIIKSAKASAAGNSIFEKAAYAFKTAGASSDILSVAISGLTANITTGLLAAFTGMIALASDLGTQMQQSVAHLAAMTGSVQMATEAQRALNDVYRNTNFQEEAVMNMGEQLMRMGYSAQNAAGLIQLCADAAAGLGTGQQGAQQLVDAISRMQAVGELTSKQMVGLKMAGVDMDAAFKSLGMNGEQAMKAVENGTLDTQQAIGALTEYLHQYDGKMAESKNNTIDAWGDVTGNLQTFCAEIGNSIFDAFNQSEIVQELIDFTQSLVDMVRSDATGAFTDLKAIAGEVLDFIGGLLGFVLDTIKLIIVILHDAYAAFKSFGAQVVDAIRPAVDAVMALYNAVKAVMSSIGKNFGSEVKSSWSATFGSNLDPEERAERMRAARTNNFRTSTRLGSGSGGSRFGGGGGGGGSAKAQLTEEEKAVDALVKKYADAEKQKWALLKSSLELAKVNTGMLVGEAKAEQTKQDKINELKLAHDQLMDSYKKELMLAGQIKDADKRDKTIDSIMAQIKAEKELYDAKVDAVEWEKNYRDLQRESKSMVDLILGDTDQTKQKIEKIKEDLTNLVQSVDSAMAMPTEEDQLSAMAKILKTTPEALAEDLAAKGQSLAEFAENYKRAVAETDAAKIASLNNTKSWADYTVKYASDVGKSLGSAFNDWITGAKTASQAMKDFAQSIIQNAIKLLAEWVGVYLTLLAFGLYDPTEAAKAATKIVLGVGEGGKTVKEQRAGKATGGYITGPGTGTSDSIPMMLSNGEYVLRSSAVDRIGVGVLDAMNAGAVPQLAGGDEGTLTVSGGSTVVMNISALDASSFRDFLNSGGLDQVKQALFEDNRQFAAEAGVW